jgi:glycosyltransferase involved in cell wall biosynthesis
VDVVCTSAERLPAGVGRVVETLSLRGRRVPHRALGGTYRAYAYHDRRAASLLERLRAEVDLVHTWPAGCERTLAAARRIGRPGLREVPSAHTQTAYEDAAREAAAIGVELPRRHHHRFDRRHLARELREFAAADFLLVPSAYVERTFVERGHAPERLLRHRYGYDPGSFASPGQVERRDGGLTAVFVGRGEPNKGLHHGLRAWADSGASERGRLLVCGEVLPAYRARLEPLLGHSSVEELGFVADVGSVMRRADLLLLPSVTEGSALVTYEAQAVGCTLLVSEAAGAVCTHMEEGLVHAPGDVAALTEHLRLVDRDRELLLRLREHALANARRLTWAAAGEALEQAYVEGLRRFEAR